jgi:L-ascorbate metabolism protein UlaG (beta-lactamase superfamily)
MPARWWIRTLTSLKLRWRPSRAIASVAAAEREMIMLSRAADEPRRNGWRQLFAWVMVLWPAVAASAAFGQCFPVADRPAAAQPAAFEPDAVPAGSVRLTFLGHSSFLIETPAGASAVTDYNGWLGGVEPPDIVTMNNAHPTHYTDHPDPKIEHVLRGWDPGGGVARHDLTYLDLHVRNVPTNVREAGGVRVNGNSIFVFETAGLCIAHLGHLHHLLTDVHLGELGQIDVLLVPVDGSFTMAQELMVEVIDQIRPALVIPMHYFSPFTLARFLDLVRERYHVMVSQSPTVTLARATLPYRQVLVLPGG